MLKEMRITMRYEVEIVRSLNQKSQILEGEINHSIINKSKSQKTSDYPMKM